MAKMKKRKERKLNDQSPAYLKRTAIEPDQFRRYQKQIRTFSGKSNRALRGWAKKILAKLRGAAHKMGWDPKDGRAVFGLYLQADNTVMIYCAAGSSMPERTFRKKFQKAKQKA